MFFAESYKYLNDKYFTSIETAAMFWRVGNYLKHALNKKYINKKDLYTSDSAILSKINKNQIKDITLKKLWIAMNSNRGFRISRNFFDPIILCKSRIVDAVFLEKNKIIPISERNRFWKNILRKNIKQKKHRINFYEN